ncbi:MAG: hypothetical protein BWX47_01269 [candidate division Hyd24-12 bacterium ADurb.Bin004]|nr:MAG: hypothetical protein BWX47_01269 [candidate division Hyd24-12 bacterium ADurb.Bin004]
MEVKMCGRSNHLACAAASQITATRTVSAAPAPFLRAAETASATAAITTTVFTMDRPRGPAALNPTAKTTSASHSCWIHSRSVIVHVKGSDSLIENESRMSSPFLRCQKMFSL